MHTFNDPLQRALQIGPDRLALIDGDARFSFAEFAQRCAALVGGLRALGLESGDRVAILAANSHRYIEAYVAIPAGGLVIVPLNTRHADPEVRYALQDSGATVLLTDRDPMPFADLVSHVISLPDRYESLVASARAWPLGDGVGEDDLAGLFYTGGTTGASKGVMLSHRNLIANTYHWLLTVPQGDADRALVMAPLFHAAGSNGVLASIWTGGTQIPLDTFNPVRALELIERHGVTVTMAVPTMLAAIAEEQLARPREVGSMRVIAHGGSPIATEVLRRTHAAFPDAEMIELYGATELSPLATAQTSEQTFIDQARARSCGRALPGCDVRVRDANDCEVARGDVGEVVVRGPNVMLGYWNKPEATAAVLKDGAYWTGDLGFMDDAGYLFLVDRSKDMIVTGGENVYCTEVEEVLYRHPAVLEAAVFGVPDDKWGEVVHAVVVPRTGASDVDTNEIIRFCRTHIAGYKVPKAIDLRADPLPKSGPGKVLKRELRAPFWTGRDRGVG
jgi:long-chain acyl-CoA synthetase